MVYHRLFQGVVTGGNSYPYDSALSIFFSHRDGGNLFLTDNPLLLLNSGRITRYTPAEILVSANDPIFLGRHTVFRVRATKHEGRLGVWNAYDIAKMKVFLSGRQGFHEGTSK
jgi:hypothetical protein